MMPGGSRYMERDCLRALERGELRRGELEACAARVAALAEKYAPVAQDEGRDPARRRPMPSPAAPSRAAPCC